MERRRDFAAVLAFCILSNAFSLPIDAIRFGRYGPLNYRHPFLLLRVPAIQNDITALNERFTRQNNDLANNPSPLPIQTEMTTSEPLPAVTVMIPLGSTSEPITNKDITQSTVTPLVTTSLDPDHSVSTDTATFSPTTTTLEPKTNEYDKKTEQTTSTTISIPVTLTTEPKPLYFIDETSTSSTTNQPSKNFNEPNHSVAPMDPAITLRPKLSDYSKQKELYQTTEAIDDLESDDEETISTSSSSSNSGGSNLFSLLNLASGLFPASSGASRIIIKMMRDFLINNSAFLINRRYDVTSNSIDEDYTTDLKPPPPTLQRQEDNESSNESSSSSESFESKESGSKNNAKEVSVEENNTNASQQTSESNEDASNSDSDEIPDGDGQGGGILGILASLSGGEDGQSDIGSLLATVGGIIANLSGDGFDLNAVLGSGLGLLAGLLSEGEENPGAVIASYLLTSLDTITGGGANNNGAFFANLISKLVTGTSAAVNEEGSDEDKEPMKDSAGFFASFLMSLLGDMSKGSSSLSSSHPSHKK